MFPSRARSFANFRYDMLNNPNGAYGIDPLNFDAASGLVFWLGGLPQNTANSYLPAGFNANPAAPFTQGTPRTEPFFNFVADRLGGSATTAGSNATTGPPAGFTDNSGPSGTGGYLRVLSTRSRGGCAYVYFRTSSTRRCTRPAASTRRGPTTPLTPDCAWISPAPPDRPSGLPFPTFR